MTFYTLDLYAQERIIMILIFSKARQQGGY